MKERLAEVDGEMEKLSSSERHSASKVVELVDLLGLEVSSKARMEETIARIRVALGRV